MENYGGCEGPRYGSTPCLVTHLEEGADVCMLPCLEVALAVHLTGTPLSLVGTPIGPCTFTLTVWSIAFELTPIRPTVGQRHLFHALLRAVRCSTGLQKRRERQLANFESWTKQNKESYRNQTRSTGHRMGSSRLVQSEHISRSTVPRGTHFFIVYTLSVLLVILSGAYAVSALCLWGGGQAVRAAQK